MEETEILLFPWRAKGVITSKIVMIILGILSAISLFICFIYAFAFPPSCLFVVMAVLFVISLFCHAYNVFLYASNQIVYVFTKEKLRIERRVYKPLPTISFLFFKGVLDNKKHTHSCNTPSYELCYLIDSGENTDIVEKQSHLWNGFSLIDRTWDYSYDRSTHKKVQITNIRKSDWDSKLSKITQWISEARKSVGKK